MDGKIKSALERAMERADSFKNASPEEVERMEHMPRGRAIAAAFMNNKSYQLNEALAEIDPGSEVYVLEGLQEVLLLNIALLADEVDDGSNRRAMEGMLMIKNNKKQAAAVLGEMDQLLAYYREALEQTREKFKQEFEMQSRRNPGRRGRTVEQDRMAEFREEWSSVIRQLNTRFETGLADLKERIKNIS